MTISTGPTMALFSSVDDAPGFDMKLCDEATLEETVRKALFVGDATDEQREEARHIAAELKQNGSVHFEDGGLTLRFGIEDIAAWLMEKCIGHAKEAKYSDERAAEAYREAEAAALKYKALADALRTALGPATDAIVKQAAA